ncbi:MAG: alpha/beta hydrolase [Rhizobiaceae bacterium]|nr:alpha/beta hydrolase [Rhizobiaceae bacterium]
MRLTKLLAVAALAVALAGCTASVREVMQAEAPTAQPVAPGYAFHRIFVATTRGRAEDAKAREAFGGDRSARAAFAYVDVSVPPSHKPGELSRPRTGKDNPEKHLTTREIGSYPNPASLQAALANDAAAKGGRALVFVHGFNTSFDEAVYRLAQLVHDSDYRGTPLLFTWASAGKASSYLYDRESATAARDALEGTLRLAAASGASRVDIIAHSMGSWVTMEALRQMAIAGDATLGGKLGDVVLASPDIDVDVFKSQMARIGKPRSPYIVLLSEDDRALRVSSIVAGNQPRLGDYKKASDLADYGVSVIDMSKQKGNTGSNHHKFAENTLLLRLLGQRMSDPSSFDGGERTITDRISDYAKGLNDQMTRATNSALSAPTTRVERAALN